MTSIELIRELTDGQIYNAIYDASIPTSWQKHVVGMSALLLKQRPIDLSSPLEVFMVARIRGAQVSHSSEALVVYLLTAGKSSFNHYAIASRSL